MAARDPGPVLPTVAAFVRPVLAVLTRQDWHGVDNLPAGGFVLVANHISHADPFALAHFVYDAGIPPRFLAKASIFELPLAGRLLHATGQIPVRRGSAEATQAFTAAVAAVRGGDCVIVYPEGTITADPDLWPMAGKTGAVRIAMASGCPVVPVAQWGAQEILAPGAFRPRLLPRRVMRIRAGSPVDIDDLLTPPVTRPALREGTARVMAAITRELAVLRGQPAPAHRTVR